MKITKDEANIIAGKVNELIQKSYNEKTVFDMDDVLKTGLNKTQAKVIMADLIKEKIVFTLMGRMSAHPQALAKYREGDKDGSNK